MDWISLIGVKNEKQKWETRNEKRTPENNEIKCLAGKQCVWVIWNE